MDTTPLPPPAEDFGLVDYESPKMTEHVVFKANQPESHSETENYTAAEEEEEEEEGEPSEVVLADGTEKHASEEYANGGELESSHHQQSNTEAESSISISDSQNQQLIDYDETMFAAEASGADDNGFTEYAPDFGEDYSASASASAVPEVWVHSETEWMIYLGPDQLSFDYDYQMELYTMPLVQLIDALHTDILLREDTELALEFPSLGLVIDRRDDACIDLSLQQLYNCHVAAVAMGTISIDLVNSPYFIHPPHTTIAAATAESGSGSASFTPSHESFAFIIHTRPSVSSTLARIMQVVEEYNNNNNSNDNDRKLEPTVPDLPQPGEPEAEVEDKKGNEEEQVQVTDDIQSPNGSRYEKRTAAAELLADNDDDVYEEDEDEDFVADEEEEGDHVLDDDAASDEGDFEEDDDEEDDGEEDDDAALDIENGDGDGPVNEEEEEGASPGRKRTTDDIIDLVDIDGDAEEKAAGAGSSNSSSEPVSKKPKSDGDDEIIHVDS
ncbi:hypothetical protein LPJ72_004412 [Coemansia sp. Benny D160-2]|nr:hypothetical protein LPJ72_004412 [Coemansia sp. Benny D160-2]